MGLGGGGGYLRRISLRSSSFRAVIILRCHAFSAKGTVGYAAPKTNNAKKTYFRPRGVHRQQSLVRGVKNRWQRDGGGTLVPMLKTKHLKGVLRRGVAIGLEFSYIHRCVFHNHGTNLIPVPEPDPIRSTGRTTSLDDVAGVKLKINNTHNSLVVYQVLLDDSDASFTKARSFIRGTCRKESSLQGRRQRALLLQLDRRQFANRLP